MFSSRALFLSCALALFGTGASLAADVSLVGTWNLKIVSPQGTRTPVMVLKQAGSQVSGTYTSPRGELPIAGTVTGNQFALSFKVKTESNEDLVIEYKGAVEGTSLSGIVKMGSMGEASFTGERATTTP